MSDFVRCKACGYITKPEKVKDVCPACGVPAKMMEPYTHPVSLKRRRILDLHTHPVLVHFPQAFALTLCGLSFIVFFAPAALERPITSTIKILAVLLPFFIIAAFAAGLMDGKLRFRRVTTPLLKKKIALGLTSFITSVLLAVLAVSGQIAAFSPHLIFFLLTILSSLCAALLGLIGGKLLNAKFPG